MKRDMFKLSDLTAAISGTSFTLSMFIDGMKGLIIFCLSVAFAWYSIREKRLSNRKYELEIEQLTSEKEE